MSKKKPKTYLLVVLNDGETFGGVDGAKIVEVTEEVHDAMANDHKYYRIANGDYEDDGIPKSGIIREINLDEISEL
jgi:tryptophanase